MNPVLQILSGQFAIHWLEPGAAPPPAALESDFCWTARTPDELSLVCPDHIEVPAAKTEPGWTCIQVQGPLQFELTGIIAGLSGTLADAGISIFAISTFDTDYLLVKTTDMEKARAALSDNGYSFADEPG